MEPECPMCGSTNWEPLGKLGQKMWYRCTDCGMDFTTDDIEQEVA
jgi:transposase-like protein